MADDGMFGDEWLWEDEPQESYAQIVITVVDRAPLLADARFAQIVVAALEACRADVPGTLWAYTVLPDSVRLVVGPASVEALDSFVTQFKTASEPDLLDLIQRADDDTLDAVLRFSPVWGAAIYRIWDSGYHRSLFSTEYRLSNAIYGLQHLPVELNLVEDAGAWPYTWIGGT